MWDRANKILLAVLLALVIVAALITDIYAQGGGTCVAYYIKYYSPGCDCYITEKKWRCTGWQRPRGPARGRYGRTYK